MHDLSIFTSMNRIYILLFMILALKANLQAQSNGYGVRVGSGFSSQRWQGGSGRNPLLTYHADYYMDSESEKGNILYLALGYHLRGSSIYINRFVDQFGNVYSGSNFAMKFHNAVLELGAKKAKTVNNWRLIYGLGIRGEYTFKHKLEIYQGYEDFIRKFNYGFTLLGAAETRINKFAAFGIEARICPDASRQVYVPAAIPIYDPFTGCVQPRVEQSIRNLSVEVGVYIRLIQIIQYIE